MQKLVTWIFGLLGSLVLLHAAMVILTFVWICPMDGGFGAESRILDRYSPAVRLIQGVDSEGRRVVVLTEDYQYSFVEEPLSYARVYSRSGRDFADAVLGDVIRSGNTDGLAAFNPTEIRVPQNYATDFASIPWWARFYVDPFGRHAEAAIVHDWLYSIGEEGKRKTADIAFYRAMEDSGVPFAQRRIMFLAVRLGGGRGYRTEDWTRAFIEPAVEARLPENCIIERPESGLTEKRFSEAEILQVGNLVSRYVAEFGDFDGDGITSDDERDQLAALRHREDSDKSEFVDPIVRLVSPGFPIASQAPGRWDEVYQNPDCEAYLFEQAVRQYLGFEVDQKGELVIAMQRLMLSENDITSLGLMEELDRALTAKSTPGLRAINRHLHRLMAAQSNEG